MLTESLRSRVYYITADHDPGAGDVPVIVRAALAAGVGMIQYRVKNLSTREMIEEATRLARMTRVAKVPLIINDRVDVALAVGADGVHLGAMDMPVGHARRIMGPGAIIGATTPTPEDVRVAEHGGATYVAVGTVFPSTTKPEKLVLGLDGLARVQAATSLPVCAIGGIGREHMAEFVEREVVLVAVMSAIHGAPDPATSARELVELSGPAPVPRLPAP